MTFRALIAATFVLAAASAQAQTPAPYSPPEGNFTVDFPSPPNVQSREAVRSKDIGLRRYVDQERDRAFIVAVDLYPPDILPRSPNGGVYDHLLRLHAEDDMLTLVSTRAARLSGLPCLEGTFTDKDENLEIVRVLVVGDAIWRVTYAHPADLTDPEPAKAFFASFKLTNP